MAAFGQIVLGPPGSGKTTYCNGISQALSQIDRKPVLVNLDPANDSIPYKPDVNVNDLIDISQVMDSLGLGPNGAMLYCMEYLEENIEWLIDALKEHLNQDSKPPYFLFDFPGQVELYTHHQSVRNIIQRLLKLDYRLCAVHLVDAHHCSDASKYISMVLLSLKTMIQLELPHINVLSKIDLVESYGKLAFNLDFYTDVQDLNYLLEHLNADSATQKYKKLNQALVELIQEFSLVGFHTLNIQDKTSVLNLIKVVDKANGYIFGGLEIGNESIFQVVNTLNTMEDVFDIQEKYMG